MKQALIVGGANGIGLAIAHQLSRRNEIQIIHIVDREPISQSHDHIKFQYSQFDLQMTITLYSITFRILTP